MLISKLTGLSGTNTLNYSVGIQTTSTTLNLNGGSNCIAGAGTNGGNGTASVSGTNGTNGSNTLGATFTSVISQTGSTYLSGYNIFKTSVSEYAVFPNYLPNSLGQYDSHTFGCGGLGGIGAYLTVAAENGSAGQSGFIRIYLYF